MSFSECLDDLAIKKTFVFIKENLIFESVHDALTQKQLLLQRDKDNYVCKIPSRHFRVERLLKLIIRKKLCAEFIEILKKMPCHQHVYRKVLETRQKQAEPPSSKCVMCCCRRVHLIQFIISNEKLSLILIYTHFINHFYPWVNFKSVQVLISPSSSVVC